MNEIMQAIGIASLVGIFSGMWAAVAWDLFG